MYVIDDLLLFVQVVEIGSFLHTAKLLKVTHPTIARRIKNLESNLGVTLLKISTREFELTEDGRKVYSLIKNQSGAVDLLINSLESFSKDQTEPYGTIKVALPVVLAYDLITPHVPGFLLKYPKIDLVISYQNHNVDLVKEGYDLALLNHIPTQQGLNVKNVFNSQAKLYCTKKYAAKYGIPKTPLELSEHLVTGFMYADESIENKLSMTHNESGVVTVVNMPKRIVINNALHSMKLLESDDVICGFFENTDQILDREDIIHVLPDYHIFELKFYTVRHQSIGDLKTQLFCDFLEECLTLNKTIGNS